MVLLNNSSQVFKITSIIGVVVAIILGVSFSVIATSNGLGIEGDGYYFINAARIIAAHLGLGEHAGLDKTLLKEVTDYYAYTVGWWPPVYPALLAAIGFSADPYVAGRWLHVAFPLIAGVLLWLIFYRNHQTSPQAFLATALIVLSPTILWLNWFVYSEILFIVMQLLVTLTFSCYLWTRRSYWLVITVVFIALSGLTRYIGVVMALSLGITLWRINHNRPFYRKTILILICFLFSILPVILYLLFPIISNEELTVGSRVFVWSWPISKLWLFLKKSAYSPALYVSPIWWPPQMRLYFIVFALTAVAIIYFYYAEKQRRQPPADPVVHLKYFIKHCLLIYIVLVTLLALFLDHMLCFTGISPRHFSPVFVWFVILLVLTYSGNNYKKTAYSDRFMSVFVMSFFVLLITVYLVGSAAKAIDHRNAASRENHLWQNVLAPLSNIQRKKGVVPWLSSNNPGEVFHYLRTPVFALPSRYDFTKIQKNENYQKQMRQLRRILHQYNGMLIYFNHPTAFSAHYAPSLSECLKALDLKVAVPGELFVILEPAP